MTLSFTTPGRFIPTLSLPVCYSLCTPGDNSLAWRPPFECNPMRPCRPVGKRFVETDLEPRVQFQVITIHSRHVDFVITFCRVAPMIAIVFTLPPASSSHGLEASILKFASAWPERLSQSGSSLLRQRVSVRARRPEGHLRCCL